MSTWRASEDHERFHIDSGPRINALQVISEALDIPHHQQDERDDSCPDAHDTPALHSMPVNGLVGERDSMSAVAPSPGPPFNPSADAGPPPPPGATKTIVASDSDVSNGFVKDGRSLPYVFEASETGVRKRSSKILPVCAVCGKRFVCVTTMKRHLVTHTGEKPFSCKVCGKQYTQKGNLRVHERTHRNDRPFECNICHQKFYRKEPMQKHQWRQHGIVHFKSRPPSSNSFSEDTPSQTPQPPPTPTPAPVPPTPLNVEPPKPLIPLRPAKPTSYTALVDSLRAVSRESSPYRSDPGPAYHGGVRIQPPAAHQTHIDVPKFNDPAPATAVRPAPPPQPLLHNPPEQLEFNQAKISSDPSTSSNCSSPLLNNDPQNPQQLSNDRTSFTPTPTSFSYSSMLNTHRVEELKPNTHLLIVPATQEQQATPMGETAPSEDPQYPSNGAGPIKLKMKMAYQQQQQQSTANNQEPPTASSQPGPSTVVIHVKNEVQSLDSDLHEMKLGTGEMVECQCKTCGNIFSVLDPYNFRCNNCNVKYTSLPTHLIADPLQCIGCCMVFPHKPALKAHQTVSDRERPFRCCKCGYGFRQKAHLQKHQWRIHRRKLEPDPNMKEAEAFFEVIQSQGSSGNPTQNPGGNNTTITMQDIINKSVEKSIGEGPRNLMKTSSKYYSEVLGLEYEPKSSGSSEDEDSRDQPLDLSPAKKMVSRESNPLLNQPPTLPSSLSIIPTSNLDQYNPAWKKQKTSDVGSIPTPAVTHTTLPPISGLQKPMSLVTVKSYKHSSWISSSLSSSAANLEPQESNNPKPKIAENNNFVRSHMDLLKSSNTRTV